MLEGLLTTAEVCEAFKITRRTLFRWRDELDFPDPMVINGRSRRYSQKDIEFWLEYQKELNEEQGLSNNKSKGYFK
jgi:predicted DNA-binding transcriptional regulator AlpA